MRAGPQTLAPLYALAAVALVCGSIAAAELRFNLSPSMPRGLYRLTAGSIERDAIVAVCLPEESGRLGRERGYLGSGSCPGGFSPVVKLVAAVEGQEVDVRSDGVTVAGVLLPSSSVRDRDRSGRELQSFGQTPYCLQPGEVWLHAPEPLSWDSRYFGPVRVAQVLGLVREVLVF